MKLLKFLYPTFLYFTFFLTLFIFNNEVSLLVVFSYCILSIILISFSKLYFLLRKKELFILMWIWYLLATWLLCDYLIKKNINSSFLTITIVSYLITLKYIAINGLKIINFKLIKNTFLIVFLTILMSYIILHYLLNYNVYKLITSQFIIYLINSLSVVFLFIIKNNFDEKELSLKNLLNILLISFIIITIFIFIFLQYKFNFIEEIRIPFYFALSIFLSNINYQRFKKNI